MVFYNFLYQQYSLLDLLSQIKFIHICVTDIATWKIKKETTCSDSKGNHLSAIWAE